MFSPFKSSASVPSAVAAPPGDLQHVPAPRSHEVSSETTPEPRVAACKHRYEVVQTWSAFLQPSQSDAREVSVIQFSLTDLTFWVCK